MSDFAFTELLPLGHDDTPYRLVSTDGVSVVDTPLGPFLKVAPEALTLLTQEAMHDIAHFLRPGHLQQLRNILDDPEASDNDRFVALDLLKNANIAAGGVLPMCQDTGTAIVKGKKGQYVFTGGNDEMAIARGVQNTYLTSNLRYSQMAPLDMSVLGFAERAIVKAVRAPEGDFRDWSAIDRWAADIAGQLVAADATSG